MSRINIEDDKARVKTVLDKVGSLTYDQAMAINHYDPLAHRTVMELVREGDAFFYGKRTHILANPRFKPRKYIEEAVDVLIPFISNIRLNNIFVPIEFDDQEKRIKLPVSLCFSKGTKLYEIASVNNKRELEHAAIKLQKRYESLQESDVRVRFLILIKNEDLVKYMPKNYSFPYAFALTAKSEEGRTEVEFINGDLLDIQDEIEEELPDEAE